MKIERILVTGATGVVGSYVREVFDGIDLALTDIEIEGNLLHLDVRDPEAVMQTMQEISPDVVLHLAAATDVDRCEQEPDWAYHTNTIGTQNVALACQASGSVMVCISTAAVFWGDKPEPYTEFDAPCPMNIYGDSKLRGEQTMVSLLQRYYIVRAGWMIGGGEKDKKFVGKIVRKILEGGSRLRVVDDKFGSPVYARDLLQGIRRLLNTDYYGLYHIVNTGMASRYQIALAVRDILARPDVEIEPVSSAFFPLPAPRGRSEAMRNYKLDLLGLNWMRPWQAALREYLETESLPAMRGNHIRQLKLSPG